MVSTAQDTRVLISVNPRAGARNETPRIDHLAELLTQRGFTVEQSSDIEWIAAEAERSLVAGTLRAVVSAGGDGTASLVANCTPVGTPIAILPLGTENLLAKYLHMTGEPAVVADAVTTGKTIQFDAGEANGALFLLMAGCGFDAEVVRRLHSERTGHINHLSYAKPILDSVRTYEYPEVRVYCDGESEPRITAKWVFVINLPKYAGGIQFVPDASGSDGLLDVCTFKEGSIVAGLWYLGGVLMGNHLNLNDCETLRASRLRIEADAEVPYQVDGDPGGLLPVDIRVIPGRLTLWVSQDWEEPTAAKRVETSAETNVG